MSHLDCLVGDIVVVPLKEQQLYQLATLILYYPFYLQIPQYLFMEAPLVPGFPLLR